ncbi:MAG: hypothetical protein JXA77_13765 [Bacteroidales bacterium]|nr:hypothetical protein [Bacteroidales bacterium]MBN2819169.1 hypothetical protein [Bacteroidales bacterium]
MKKFLFTSTAVLGLFAMFFATSCDNLAVNDDSKITALDVELTEDDAMAEDLFNSLDGIVDQELNALDAAGYESSDLKSTDEDGFDCKVITVDKPDTSSFPKTITIDYGEGCSVIINGDTITRSGSIVITITDRWFVVGSVRTVTYNTFTVNGVTITGSVTTTNLGPNEDGNIVFEVVVDDGSLTFSDTLIYTRTSHRYREWIRTNNPLMDTVFVTGDCQGKNADGMQYQHQIQNKLTMVRCFNYNYQWTIVEGEITMERNGNMSKLNFGTGGCDGEALLTVDGETREIQVRNRYTKKRQVRSGRGGN